MSLLAVVPDWLQLAAGDLKSIGADLDTAHAAAAAPTTGLVAAGADEVSAAVTALFSEYGQTFQALGAQASTFHTQFVQLLSGAQGAYAAAEAANASPLQAVVAGAQRLAVFTPAQELLGRPLIGNGSNGTAASTNGGAGGLTNGQAAVSNSNLNGTVPLTIFQNTEPIVNASINGGSSVPLLVDTGSTGLVIPLRDIGLQHLGLPTGIGMGSYSGGDTYFYLKVNGTINFGNGIVTSPTTVDAVFFSFPGSFSNFASSNGAVGILGVGASTAGPNTISPTTALPGDLGQGVLINEPQHQLVFGPNTGNVLISTATGGGSTANLTYTVGNAPPSTHPTIVDSGGVDGTLLQSAVPGGSSVPNGTEIAVSYNGTPLYSYTVEGNSPSVITSGSQNTGYEAFSQRPIYIDYTTNTLVFDK